MPQSYATEQANLQNLLVEVCVDVNRLEEVSNDLDRSLVEAGVRDDLVPFIQRRRGSYFSMAIARERAVPTPEELVEMMEARAEEDPVFARQLLHEPRAIIQHALQVRLPREWDITATNGNGVNLHIDPATTDASYEIVADNDVDTDTDTDTDANENETDIDTDIDTVDVSETDIDVDTDTDIDTDVDVDVVAVDIDTDTDIDTDIDTDDVTDTDIDTDIDDVHVTETTGPAGSVGEQRYLVPIAEREKFENYWNQRRSSWVTMDSRN